MFAELTACGETPVPHNVSRAVHARAEGVTVFVEVEILIRSFFEPCCIEIVLEYLPADNPIIRNTVHRRAARARSYNSRVHIMELAIYPDPAACGKRTYIADAPFL